MYNIETIDRLVPGINTIISQCRSSLSDEEVCLLTECVAFLEQVKLTGDPKAPVKSEILTLVCHVLLRLILTEGFEKLKNILL